VADRDTFVVYTESYKEACFQAWYAAGKPTLVKDLLEALPEDEHDRKPHPDVVRRWRNADRWDLRADKLDAQVTMRMEDTLINQRVEMLQKQAQRAKKLQEDGMEYLEENGFDSSSSALTAVLKGAELERTSLGLSDTIMKLAKLTNDELTSETQKLLQRFIDNGQSMDDILDAATIPEEDIEDDEDED